MKRAAPASHREELLRAFRIGPADLEANRAGRLGPGQIRRLRRNIWINLAAAAVLAAPIIAFAILSPRKNVVHYTICGIALGLVVLMAVAWIRGIRRALRAGAVVCFAGPVTVQSQSRGGTTLIVQAEHVRLWTGYWHVGRGLPYQVYVAPAAKLVVAMEPDGWE
jgi:hypothetical protein